MFELKFELVDKINKIDKINFFLYFDVSLKRKKRKENRWEETFGRPCTYSARCFNKKRKWLGDEELYFRDKILDSSSLDDTLTFPYYVRFTFC